ncbi:hypothetical protein LOK49_LG06G02593 [Camellia lanceoleosa]|uniref:Uncharacterized protein n=1 Tax=Camellia lanceoleosa TaxID=1840588 RepID=A0ACC0H998_9ERIC|nr:hypothetical protein LOK49_LG06G02593 [Camellia lanceoleosa]
MDITFSTMAVWVHVSNLPLISMTSDVGVLLGNQLGQFLDMEYGDDGIAWGRTLRLRVEINIAKPLRRGLKLAVSGRDSIWVTLTYEKLPNFCFYCGLLGHSVRDCANKILGGEVEVGAPLQYGSWLRAEPFRGRHQKDQQFTPGRRGEAEGSSKMCSEEVEVQQGGQGDFSNHSFVPMTAEHRRSEQATIGKINFRQVQSSSPIIGITRVTVSIHSYSSGHIDVVVESDMEIGKWRLHRVLWSSLKLRRRIRGSRFADWVV